MPKSCCAYDCTEIYDKNSAVSFHRFPKDPERRKLWTIYVRRKNFVPNDHTSICSKHFEEDCFDREKFGGRWLKPTAVPTLFNFPQHLQLKKISRGLPEKRLSPENAPPVEQEINKCGEENNVVSKVTKAVKTKKSRLAHIGDSKDDNSLSPAKMKKWQIIYLSKEIKKCEENNVIPKVAKAVKTKKRRLAYIGDFENDNVLSPAEMKKWQIAKTLIQKQKKRLKALQKTNSRLKKKVANLSNMLQEPKQENNVSENTKDALEMSTSGVMGEILKRGTDSREKYSDELRHFAMALYFHSPTGYNYVRKTFDTCLPHPATLRKWHGTFEKKPCFTIETQNALKTILSQAAKKNKEDICASVIDKMLIRKDV